MGCTASTRRAGWGSLVFDVSGYGGVSLDVQSSEVFTVGAYDWQIRFYEEGVFGHSGGYVAVYLFLVSKKAKVRATFELSLVDITGSTPPRTMRTVDAEFDSGDRTCFGHPEFMRKSELEASPYLRGDRLTIECAITICKEAPVSSKSFAEVPPSDITDHLRKLWQGKEGSDVTFEVQGEAFPAHKTVLAMRSPVFKAELYGALRENDMGRVIIGDMQPAVFEALLHFIYTDSLPTMDDLYQDQDEYKEIIGHLLVAADRYAMERLKIICESILCKNIDVKTVVTTLALADQHHCNKLTDACIEFIASLGKVDDIIASQGYAELKRTCPLALLELWEKATRLYMI
ncbi:hypothetical protein CFC21_046875 [Triticum aestivum]|uniref:Speckle-type POZ protein-like protein n=4 Tax=Triticinae TaxID=1648030 RepID=A0A453ELM4_AEGTS|nr:BTB/POZ and MATH domain-containing protein 2-like [Aegilops tauschii subsp. strangulata]XP_044353211.1 BTB/POZ and MATH domain-containing protein 2-like [Triticum aestivum]KAF7036127.1 hypothetical protein CFC21_046875 [Triticum aestivum]